MAAPFQLVFHFTHISTPVIPRSRATRMGSNTSQPATYDTPAYAVVNIFLILTTIAVVARATSRHMSKAAFGIDDAMAYLAFVTNAASLININIMASVGAFDMTRRLAFSPEEAASFAKSFNNRNLASAALYIVTITTAKLSIIFLFRRIFHVYTGWFRAFWWYNLLIVFPGWTLTTLGLMIYLQLDSFAYGKPANAYGIAAAATVNAISDITVLILPISGVAKLHLPRNQKIGIIGLFSLGFLTTAVSIARASLSFQQAVKPPQWNPAYQRYYYITLGAAETSASCLCACIPVARPFFVAAGEFATQSLNVSSLRHIISKSSLSSRSNRSNAFESRSRDIDKNDAISRTVDIDMDSMPLRKSTSARQSLDRTNILGYTENHEGPATARAWA
ncbi:hypothetical protein CC86DRAFT_427812 [Ophiobolus disseminans]|uniref:Rhodopsin domain-containing protein n=1 Tax=Ophiobolus disseminans TaxID=1469910 RepID=A0A6A6ZJ12_9PLEO|nr:hypothetical protein CC86DRAFT_427812 [Ophiobolus disseminans]